MKQNSLHIIYIITKLELGGAQKVCLSLLNQISSHANCSATIITGTDGPLLKHIPHSQTILLPEMIREVSYWSVFREIRLFLKLIFILQKLKKLHPRVAVHTHSTKAGLLGRWAAFFARIPTKIHTIHGFAFHDHQNSIIWLAIYILESITAMITTHFICVSQHDAQIGTRLFPFFKERHSIIRAATAVQKYTSCLKDNCTHDPFTFGTIACMKPQKNLFDLLKAFQITHTENTNTRLEIIGDGFLRPSIEAWITAHNLDHAVSLLGWQESVTAYLSKWHAFVLTSLWEGLPCAVVEARLYRLPIISYKTGGIPEIVFHHKNGLLFEQKDWRSLAQGMLTLSTKKTLVKRLRSYPDNLADFSEQSMFNKHLILYKSLVSHQNIMP